MILMQINLDIVEKDRSEAAAVYAKYKTPFLSQIVGAKSKQLLIRAEEVQVMHGFDSLENAQAYLSSSLFANEVVSALKPLLQSQPDVRIFTVV